MMTDIFRNLDSAAIERILLKYNKTTVLADLKRVSPIQDLIYYV
jgi:hypothetical protein